MNVILAFVILGIAFAAVALDFWKKAPYMGAAGGIVFVMLGIFLLTDATLTQAICLPI